MRREIKEMMSFSNGGKDGLKERTFLMRGLGEKREVGNDHVALFIIIKKEKQINLTAGRNRNGRTRWMDGIFGKS